MMGFNPVDLAFGNMDALRVSNERLQTENDKLRDKCDTYSEIIEYMVHPDLYEQVKAENEKLREELSDVPKCESCEAMLDCDECLRADASQKERKRLDYESAKLRELVRDMAAEMRGLGVDFKRVGWCDYADRMRELGVEV